MALGRPPKSEAEHKLNRNPGHREHVTTGPTPKITAPRIPKQLRGGAGELEWNRICGLLTDLGIITLLDRGLIAAYCMAWESFLRACQMLRETKLVVKDSHGNPIINPFEIIKQRASSDIVRYGGELGLTPCSRPRIPARPKVADAALNDDQRAHLEVHDLLFGDEVA